MSAQTINTTTIQTEQQEAEVKVSFGDGRFSPAMEEMYKDMISLLGIEPKKAEKIARQFGSDFGAAMRNAPATAKVGKVDAKGRVTLADAGKLKGVIVTKPMSIKHALQWIDECDKHEISLGHTKWKLNSVLTEYVDEMEVK